MTQSTCAYSGARDDHLVSYLYEEMAPSDRLEFEHHLTACAACRDDLDALRGVRAHLGRWAPPEPVRASARDRRVEAPAGRALRWWQQVPAWAGVAAALLCIGVAAGIANLDVRYDRDGLTVRTGWMKPPAAPTSVAGSSPAAGAPWRADLAAVERQLRSEFRAAGVSAASAPPLPSAARRASAPAADPDIVRRVRALIEESERRQQRELALRVAAMSRDIAVERRSDLAKIDRSLGQIENSTGIEVLRQRELLNYLVRVSQKP